MTGPHLTDAAVLDHCRARYPEQFAPAGAELAHVCLSFLPARRFVTTHDLADVAADLAAGMWMEQRSGDRGPYFVLSGSHHEVFVTPAVARDADHALADVTSIRSPRGLARRSTVVPASVGFYDKRHERYCDLAVLHRQMNEAVAAIRERDRLRRRMRDAMRSPRLPPQPLGELRAEVSRHFAPLRMMLDLLARRSRDEDEVVGAGVVVGHRPDEVYVRLRTSSGEFTDQRSAELLLPGGGVRASVLAVEEYEGDVVLCLAPPRNAQLMPGLEVSLREDGRFAMRRHREALEAFLAGDVEGDWEHLATLLCRPSRLPAFEVPMLDDADPVLHAKQEAAVAGAVATPHAFLVQGPPGTGKSTVITEVVRRLVGRGERVLLLAPMHVAVDEVLGRAGSRPGVFALRVAADERKVDAALQRFLPDHVAETYLRDIRTPRTAKGPAWQAEIDRLTVEERLLTAYLNGLAQAERDRMARDAAVRDHTARSAERERSIGAAFAEVRAADEALTALAGLRAAVGAEVAALQGQLDAVPGGRRLLTRALSALGGEDRVSGLWRAHREATGRLVRLDRDVELWHHHRATAAAEADRLRRDHTASAADWGARLAAYGAAVAGADRHLERSAAALAAVMGREPDRYDAQEWQSARAAVTIRIQQLHRRIGLEQRWFETAEASGPDAAGRLAAELRQTANLVCATTTGVASADLGAADFDTLIVDEASRVVDSEFLIGAIRARRWILVGDQRQLPPYVDQVDEHHLHALTALHLAERDGLDLGVAVQKLAGLWGEEQIQHQFRTTSVTRAATTLRTGDRWPGYRQAFRRHLRAVAPGEDMPERTVLAAMRRHLVESLFDRCAEGLPGGARTALLVQHRSIEPIAALVRQPVYQGRYDQPTDGPQQTPLVLPAFGVPVVFADTSAYGRRARDEQVGHGFVNHLEAEWVRRICVMVDATAAAGATRPTVSVLSFYRHQARRIRELLGAPGYGGYPALDFRVVDVIDRIQGQQSDVVILSFCRAAPGRDKLRDHYGAWLQDVRRLNVAVTRARRGLFLVGHGDTLRNLRGVPAAEEFYRHLFAQVTSRPDVMTVVRDL
uniref:AAA+ ATPase domain-containing protein n=1 Tax=uncultured soil bacterium TaxID=164851 RepID=E2D2M5_9BACT|nr:hypothetical protein [uncultured soil bacterium]